MGCPIIAAWCPSEHEAFGPCRAGSPARFPSWCFAPGFRTIAILVQRSYAVARPENLATDLARYGTAAQWRGVYYRNEKIGFTVSQTIATDDGFELQEDGRLQMSLLGAQNVVSIRTTSAGRSRLCRSAVVRFFAGSRDRRNEGPRRSDGRRLHLAIDDGVRTPRRGSRRSPTPPVLTLNLARRLADAGLVAGAHYSGRFSIRPRSAIRRSRSTSARASS